MPFDVSAIKAKAAETPKRTSTRTKRDLGPNPWLDKNWANGLWASYEADEAYAADFKGAIENVPARRGKNKGEPIEKVTGEAGDAMVLIREAAEKLGIGSSIRYRPAARNGYVNVTWYGKTRKQSRNETATAPAVSPAES
jgi:hypothetical protein